MPVWFAGQMGSWLSSRGRRADELQQKDAAHTQPPALGDAEGERGQPIQIFAGQVHGMRASGVGHE